MGRQESDVSVASRISMFIAAVLIGAVVFAQLDGPVLVALTVSGVNGVLGALAGWSLIALAYDVIRKR